MNLKSLEKKGFKYVCGVDEAGRGPLAGPLSLSFFIISIKDYKKVLNPLLKLGLNDSKKLKEEKREQLFRKVQPYGLNSMISAKKIDEKGIAECYRILIKRLLEKSRKLFVKSHKSPHFAKATRGKQVTSQKIYYLLDGAIKFPEDISHEVIIGGDGIEPVIMGASIVSKVKRDRRMKMLAKKYTKYELDVNKGYGTKKHREAIKKFGLSEIHRKSFCGRFTKK